MELLSSAHVRLARAALASGSTDALDALTRAASASDPALRQSARAALIGEARARGLTTGLPDDVTAGPDDFARLRASLAAAFVAPRGGV